MNRSKLDNWIQKTEGLNHLECGDIKALQLRKLNGLLRREKERGGFYARLQRPFEYGTIVNMTEGHSQISKI
jgi:hypothetical protein